MPISKTIHALLNEVGGRSGIPHQAQIYGTNVDKQPNSEYARDMRSVAYDACQHLLRTRAWEDTWRLAEFSIGPSSTNVPLPPDMDRLRTETFFEKNQGWWRPAGPVAGESWRFFRNYSYNPIQPIWRFGEGELLLHRLPETTRVFEFEYITQWPVIAMGGKMRREFQFDTDATLFDNQILKGELNWRLLKQRGEKDWKEERALALAEQDTRAAQEQGGSNRIIIGLGPDHYTSFDAFTTDGLTVNVPLY